MIKKMLIVEDCASDIFLIERMLSDAGETNVDIIGVPRLIDAFQMIDKNHFDVVMLDLNLLDMDGVASVAALSAEAPDTPIIVYSGMSDNKIKTEAMLCGARNYLVKGQENAASLRMAINNAIATKAA